jgi:hypothetical protein
VVFEYRAGLISKLPPVITKPSNVFRNNHLLNFDEIKEMGLRQIYVNKLNNFLLLRTMEILSIHRYFHNLK